MLPAGPNEEQRTLINSFQVPALNTGCPQACTMNMNLNKARVLTVITIAEVMVTVVISVTMMETGAVAWTAALVVIPKVTRMLRGSERQSKRETKSESGSESDSEGEGKSEG